MTQVLHQAGAGEATESLFDRHYGRIRAYCLGQLRDCEEANDAAQSTFLYAFAALQRGVAPRNELPWLFTIAHNVCRTRRRSLRRRSRLESAVDLDTISDTVGRDDPSHDELDRLGSSLAALPENQRKALLLREWRGLSYTEVAERMGLTESAVEAVLFRARRSLAQKLRDRAASLVGWALFLPGLRRIGSLTGTAKAAAATVVVGVAAGTAIQPLVHSPRDTTPAVAHAAPGHVFGAQLAAGTTTPHPAAHAKRKAAATPVRGDRFQAPRVATPTAAAPASASQPAPVTEPTASGGEPQPTPQVTAGADADARATAPAGPRPTASPSAPAPQQQAVAAVAPHGSDVSAVAQVLPSQVQDALPDVPVPGLPDPADVQTPNLPSLVNDVTDAATSAVSTATQTTPALPSLPAPPLPTLPPPPLPKAPTEGTPLQPAP